MAYTFVYGGAAVAGCIAAVMFLFLFFLQSIKRKHDASLSASGPKVVDKKTAKGALSNNDPNKDREPGAWVPVPFEYPSITPVTDDLRDIAPRPYRPFKAGPYHVTMGIRNMVWDDWIEVRRIRFAFLVF
ncbi:hypothetical protein EVG20_g11533 [Dentipellis fragilis]|uniref:Uncharacterized protein n=1 Tax=Dentipellis fragilis TaxID=205917 RepID=A0A4Y9XKA7_9AGAM|nr:hypothetical protein EVG20_g11533 [Dentipellis fragilis]